VIRGAAIVLLPLAGAGCNWLTDFRQQPAIQTWGSRTVTWVDTTSPFRGNPQGSVPITGMTVAAYEIGYGVMPAVTDSFTNIANPVPATQESVDRGWKQFEINCAVCHGEGAAGNGAAVRFGVGAPPLIATVRSDGYIWGKIRNGGPLMPPMNRVEERERWHIINYIRALQGRVAGVTAQKGPPGAPGVTGDALPGATMLAPTRYPPTLKPTYTPTGGAAAAATETKHGGHE
jgi:mono/diheme cytochrome c family protein